MCNTCINHHKELFQFHHQYKLDKEINEIFTGFCNVENHLNKLEYFCKDHNQLCCAACISKLKGKGFGDHIDCDICFIEDIKDEKKGILNENIKFLEEISKTMVNSINQLKNIFDIINQKKEKLKLDIQKIFTQLRNTINDREDQLLLEVDNKFDSLYFTEELIKKSDKLPKSVKMSLEAGKNIIQEFNDNNKLSSFINDCIKIETDVKDINTINENIEKANMIKLDTTFTYDDFTSNIKCFGKINYNKIIDKKKEYEMIKKELEKKEHILRKKLEQKMEKKLNADERLKIEEKELLNIKKELEENEKLKKNEEEKFKKNEMPQKPKKENIIKEIQMMLKAIPKEYV